MFGRAPTPYPYAPQPYFPQGGFAPTAGGQPPFPTVPSNVQPSWPPGPAATAQQQRPPIIRGVPPDDPPLPPQMPTQPAPIPAAPPLPPAPTPTPVSIPTPEELGLAGSRQANGNGDWLPGYRRLLNLGAYSFRIDRVPAGGVQITCLLPAGQAQRVRRVETQAATEAEAVRLAVEEAERCSAQAQK
jgi:hypothetical protein